MSLRGLIRDMQGAVDAATEAAVGRLLALVARAIRLELRALARAAGVWTANAARQVVARLRRMLARLVAALAGSLGEDLRQAAARSLADAAAYLRAGDALFAEPRPLRLDTVDTAAVALAREPLYTAAFGRFAAGLVRAAEAAALAAVLVGRSHPAALGVVAGALRREAAADAWKLHRIAETEVSAAYNAAQLEALIAEDVPEDRMLKRLVAKFDSVTGRDSVALHGQVRPVREPFYDSVGGRLFMAPPNRPRDREIIVGQRAGWGAVPDLEAPVLQASPRAPPQRPLQARPAPPGQAVRKARNLRAGDVLVAPGRPRIVSVAEARGRIAVRTDSGLLVYFAAGAAIGILTSS